MVFATNAATTIQASNADIVRVTPPEVVQTNEPYLFETTAKKQFRPHTYYVSIPLPGRDTCVIFKTRPVSDSNKPDRLDGITGIGATVWFDEEWQEMTNQLGSKNNILGLTNYLDTIAQQMIDLTPGQE